MNQIDMKMMDEMDCLEKNYNAGLITDQTYDEAMTDIIDQQNQRAWIDPGSLWTTQIIN